MYALENDERIEWNGNQWNPYYLDDLPILSKIINHKVQSYHWDDLYCKPTDFVSDY